MKKVIYLFLLLMVTVACNAEEGTNNKSNLDTEKKEVKEYEEISATVKTNKGDIHLKLFPNEAPITVTNFVNLANEKYYNGLIFHRVIDNFMVQGGDPLGTGTGGPGYRFEDETKNGLTFENAGKLAMANAGPNTNGSQIFITTVPTEWLNGNHTIFGEIKSDKDMDILLNIKQDDVIEEVIIEGNYDDLLYDFKDRVEEWNKILIENDLIRK